MPRREIKVVLDCNVLVSAGIRDSGVCREVFSHALQNTIIITSDAMEQEYATVIRRKKFRLHTDTMIALLEQLRQVAFRITPGSGGFSLPDDSDLPYLEAAVTAGANFLITGNGKHFPARQYGTVEVVSPREFLQRVIADKLSSYWGR